MSNLNLKIAMENFNSNGSTTNAVLRIGNVCIYSQGSPNSRALYRHFSAASSVLLKGTAGTLHKVVINKPGNITSTLTLYDSLTASGSIIAIIDTGAEITELEYDVEFDNGLFVVSDGPQTADLTVLYD